MTEFISLDASIDLSKWDSSIAQMISDANKIESILKGFSAVSIRVDVDDAALVDAVGLVDRLNAQSANVRIDATVGQELQNAQTLIDRIDADKATVTLDALLDPEFERASVLIGKLDSEKATVNISANVDTEFENAQKLINRLDSESIDVPIDATNNADTAINDVESRLQNLQTMAALQLTLDAAAFLQTFESLPIVSTMLDVETQTQRVIGMINRDLPNAGDIINEVYTNNWGSSREEVANVIITLAQLKDETGEFIVQADELGTVAQSAFAAAQLAGGDLEATITAASALVRNDFVGSYEEAFDFIAEGSQRGLGLQGDFLDTIIEYSSTFESLGISAEGFFNLMESGANAGVFNIDKVADSYKEMLNLTKEEVQIKVAVGDETDRTKALTEIGLFDEGEAYAAGQISGDEFAQGVLDALNAIEDPAEQQRLAKAIFSPTMIEDAGLDNILATSLESPENVGAWENAATEGANIINDTLGSALAEMVRSFETEMADALKTVLVDSGFLEQLENAAMTFADAIQEGATIGEAIELALMLPENQIARIESAIGNFLIGILEVTANIGEFLGRDVSGIRATVADAGATQLAFDLKFATNEEEVAQSVAVAVGRGVEAADIDTAITTAIDEQLAEGDIAGAQALFDSVTSAFNADNLSEYTQGLLDAGVATEEILANLESIKANSGYENPLTFDVDADILALSSGAIGLDEGKIQATIDQTMATTEAAYEEAIANLDLDTAIDVGKSLEIDPAETSQHIQEQFRNAFAMATESGDIEGADALWDKMLAIDPDFQLAGDLQMLLHEAEQEVADTTGNMVADLGETTVTVTTAYSDITGASNDAATAVKDDTSEFSAGFSAIGLGSAVLLLATGNYNALASAIQSSAPGMVTQLEEISNALAGFATAGGEALQVSANLQSSQSTITAGGEAPTTGGKTSRPAGHAEGGFKPEGMGGWVGEEGPEYQVAGQDVSILNNQTSEALWTAMQSMGMRGGGANTTYNYNITMINNNASGAAHYGAMQGFANKIRGQ